MAEEQKPVEVPKEEVAAPAVEPVVAETKAVEETPAAATEAPAATEAAATTEETPAAAEAAAEEPKAEEAKKEEVKPIEEGSLEHKGQGANFPKNLLYSKKFFWFGTEPVDVKAITSFKADKAVDVAHHVASWAAETGKGLLFFSEKSDKAAPHGAIQLSEASEPVADGASKFYFSSKGHKHTFKASSAAERDSWVAELKAKITEAKELVATVTESETYKTTLASLKPAPPVKKEEKAAPAAEAPKEEPAAPAEEATEPAVEEAAKEEPKKEEPKRRSASRKRASIFGNFLGKKEEKVAEPAAETKAPEAEVPAAEPVAAEPAAVEPVAEVAPVEAEAAPAAEEAKPEEPKEEPKKEEKPAPAKRASIFGNLGFGKKKTPEAAPAPAAESSKDAPAAETVAETAPVIPAVETTEPLSAEVASPATVPTETVEVAPAVNGDKKDAKNEKRKSSLPFALGGKKEKAEKVVSSDEEGAPKKKDSPFSKLRATIRGKKAEKAPEKAEEAPAVPEPVAETAEAPKEDAVKAVEPEAAPEVPAKVEEEVPAKPLETTPAVAAAA